MRAVAPERFDVVCGNILESEAFDDIGTSFYIGDSGDEDEVLETVTAAAGSCELAANDKKRKKRPKPATEGGYNELEVEFLRAKLAVAIRLGGTITRLGCWFRSW